MRAVAFLLTVTTFFVFLGTCEGCLQEQEASHQNDQTPPDSDGEKAEQMTSDELVDAYEAFLLSGWFRSSEKISEETKSEIARRDDPHVDERLRILAEKLIRLDAEAGNLDYVGMGLKRTKTRTEDVLSLLGRRCTTRSIDYLLSKVKSKYAVVRTEISYWPPCVDLTDPSNSAVMTAWARLLWDQDVFVAQVSWGTLKNRLARVSSVSDEVILAVVKGQNEMRPRIRNHPKDYEYKVAGRTLDAVVSSCQRILNDRLAKATDDEKGTAERLLRLLNEPDAAPPAG